MADTVKVSGQIDVKTHKVLTVRAQELGTTVGHIVSFGVSLAISSIEKDPRKARNVIPRDGRRNTSEA